MKNLDEREGREPSFGQKVAHVADVAVGDVILGGLGRGAFHLGKIPGVKKVGVYIGENVADGYHAAEIAEKKRKALASLRKIVKDGVAMSPETLRQIAVDNGLDPVALSDLAAKARASAGKESQIPAPSGDGTYQAPATA